MKTYLKVILIFYICSSCKKTDKQNFFNQFEDVAINYQDSMTLVEGRTKGGVPYGSWSFRDLQGNVLVEKSYLDSLNRHIESKYFDSEGVLFYWESALNGKIQAKSYIGDNGVDLFAGKLLFNEYCSSCHTQAEQFVGPHFRNKSFEFVFGRVRNKLHVVADSRIEKLDSAHIRDIIEYVNLDYIVD